jgi:hypothetical protein
MNARAHIPHATERTLLRECGLKVGLKNNRRPHLLHNDGYVSRTALDAAPSIARRLPDRLRPDRRDVVGMVTPSAGRVAEVSQPTVLTDILSNH